MKDDKAFVNEVVYVYGEEEWDGMYVNGVMQTQDHMLDTRNVVKILEENQPFKVVLHHTVSAEWLEENGSYPHSLEDIPQEAIVSTQHPHEGE